MRDFVRHVHFVGIGGAGMSGIAEVLSTQQYRVSGSDLGESATTQHLRSVGVRVFIGHEASHIAGADVVVISSAVPADNPEIVAANAMKIPVIPRAEMLGELMRFSKGVAVAGTHGKTTTTSMVASVLTAGGIDPTFVVGGLVNSANSNARLGRSEYLVAEADESDASFLHLQPQIAVITNIDSDHMETYGGDFDKLRQTYLDFLYNLPFYGLAVLGVDDPVVRELSTDVQRRVLTYGLSEEADVRARNVRHDGLNMRFDLYLPKVPQPLDVSLPMPGEHNVQNALGAAAVASSIGVSGAKISAGLADFTGTARRFEILGSINMANGEALLVDDYAHHPRELQATLQAARGAWPNRRIVAVFQPHRYSRTRDLLDDFGLVLQAQDPLIVTEVYPAGELPISGADGRAICRITRARGQIDPVFLPDLDELANALDAIVCDGDVVLTLGAGNIGRASRQLLAERYVNDAAISSPPNRASANVRPFPVAGQDNVNVETVGRDQAVSPDDPSRKDGE